MGKRSSGAAEDRAYLENAISTLVANIRFAAVDSEIRTICITSSVPNEGKSTIAASLAEALAAQGKRTLLVENDLHRRSQAGMLGAHARYGLYSVLVGQQSIQEAVVPTKTANLWFMDCEPNIPNPANVLSSKRYKNFVATARQLFDYVVFDTPPVSTFVDGAVVGSIADATLLVVRNNFTRRDEVAASIEQLRKADANVIGTVFNWVENERNDYYYDYYTKDGKKVKRSSNKSVPTPRTAAPAQAQQAAAVQPQAASQAQQAAAQGVAPVRTASTRRKPAADSTEEFMVNAGYAKGRQS